jgi:hypothetical protein
LSRQYRILNTSQLYRPPRPVTWKIYLLVNINTFSQVLHSTKVNTIQCSSSTPYGRRTCWTTLNDIFRFFCSNWIGFNKISCRLKIVGS